jgi:Zn-dependent oligopeptidase
LQGRLLRVAPASTRSYRRFLIFASDIAADTRDPAESYKAFRGRMPSADALLRNRGLK